MLGYGYRLPILVLGRNGDPRRAAPGAEVRADAATGAKVGDHVHLLDSDAYAAEVLHLDRPKAKGLGGNGAFLHADRTIEAIGVGETAAPVDCGRADLEGLLGRQSQRLESSRGACPGTLGAIPLALSRLSL